MSVALFGYGLCAAGYWLLLVLLLGKWPARNNGRQLLFAIGITALWATLNAVWMTRESSPTASIFVIETAHQLSWILVLIGLWRDSLSWMQRLLNAATWIVVLAAFIAILVVTERVGTHTEISVLSMIGICLSVVGIVLVEQAFRNSSQSMRPALRFLAIGAGLSFAYDLFLYSQTEVLQVVIPIVWDVRGFVVLLGLPMIVFAIQRNPNWSLDVFVSRHIVFYTSTFIAIGCYLVAIAFAGYYIRALHAEWGLFAQVFFFIAATSVLVVLLSAAWRRRLKVFISKHFYSNKYDYRIEWLRFINTLSSGRGEGVRSSAIQAIAEIFESPGGALFWQSDPTKPYVALASWPDKDGTLNAPPMSLDNDLIKFLAKHAWIIDLPEYRRAPDLYQGVQLPAWILEDATFRLITPLFELDRLVGFILLRNPPPPFELTFEDRDLLKTVGRHVATHIAQYEASRQLVEGRQLEAYSRLTAFVMHDLKNAVAQLRLLVQNAERHKGNPAFFDDAMSTISNTVERMTRLIETLRGGVSQDQRESVRVRDLLGDVVLRCSDRQPVPRLQMSVTDQPIVLADREQLTSVVEHVVRNAQDATSQDAAVTITLTVQDGYVDIAVTDEGIGMDAQFVRERLFRPFDTTKGSRGMGIGAYQVREYIASLGGTVTVTSEPKKGTCFSLRIPERTIE